MMIDLVWIALALALLFAGAEGLVRGSSALALRAGLSPLVVGLTIVAFGTSSPELVVSVKAAISQQGDIAVGNVIGSNVFNILGILGVASSVSPISAPGISTFDYVTMLVFTAILIPLLYTGRLLHRIEGGVLLLLYGVYEFFLWPA
ncbi:MAG: hypothetical protein R3296_05175 [Oleiphilaceae bacterium]|nr:hypothetical protein [Oleiphilaceae bacterium]